MADGWLISIAIAATTEEINTVSKAPDISLVGIISALSSFAWPVLAAVIIWRARGLLADVVENLSMRIKSGAALKTPWFEVDAVNVTRHDVSSLSGITSKDDDGSGERDLDDFDYHRSKCMMLAHKLYLSSQKGQMYDILIYLVPLHENQYLRNVASVEYYFGTYWDNKIFVSADAKKRFAVAISSYGPSSCSAKVIFDDGSSVIVYRFLDYEMGPLPPPSF